MDPPYLHVHNMDRWCRPTLCGQHGVLAARRSWQPAACPAGAIPASAEGVGGAATHHPGGMLLSGFAKREHAGNTLKLKGKRVDVHVDERRERVRAPV